MTPRTGQRAGRSASYGPTPLGGMVPASPVNVIGRILSPDGRILDAIDGSRADYALA